VPALVTAALVVEVDLSVGTADAGAVGLDPAQQRRVGLVERGERTVMDHGGHSLCLGQRVHADPFVARHRLLNGDCSLDVQVLLTVLRAVGEGGRTRQRLVLSSG